MAITAGIYELRTMLQTAMAVDVAGGSTTKGANVQLYSANGTNAQKFRLVYRGNGWNLVNVASGMYVDVDNYGTTDGTNIKQWTGNNNRAQRWEVVDTGETVIIDGVECIVATFGSYVTSAHNMMMDVRWAMTSNSTNIQLYHSNGTDAQKFALFPTTVLNKTIPAPSGLGWTATVGDEAAQETLPSAAELFPSWTFSPAWAPIGGNGFEYRYRTRLIDAGTLATGAWGDYTAWTAAPVTIKGIRAWLTDGIPATFDPADFKAQEVQFQVRSTSTSGADPAHGLTVSSILRAVAPVEVAISDVRVGAEGILLAYASTYTGGTTTIGLTSIKRDGEELLAAPRTFYAMVSEGDIEIPYEAMRALLSPGDSVDVYFTVGTDQYGGDGATMAAMGRSVTYAQGRTGELAATITQGAGRVLDIDAGSSGIAGAWIEHPRGIQPAIALGSGIFAAPYPFGEGCTLRVTVRNAAGTAWESVDAPYAAGFDGLKPVHAFNWKGGAFLVEVNADRPIATEFSAKADADATAYSGRAWESYAYGTAKDGAFSADGALVDGLTSSTAHELEALLDAGHVVYRAPSGEIFDAAVTAYSYGVTPDGITTITINGSRESV